MTRSTSPHAPKEEPFKNNPKEPLSAHSRLMDFHNSRIPGGMPDGAAQGAALKWLLKRFTPELCIAEYEKLLAQDWRNTPVSWLTVRKYIGADLSRENRNGNGLSGGSERILEDHGDWYTVMGADGSPSKRWRSPEAFARDTGRDVEEVRSKWN